MEAHDIRHLYVDLVNEVFLKSETLYSTITYTNLVAYQKIKSLSDVEKLSLIHYLTHLKSNNQKDYNHVGRPAHRHTSHQYRINDIRKGLLSLLLRNIDLPGDSELQKIAEGFGKGKVTGTWNWPYAPLLKLLEKYKSEHGLTGNLKEALKVLIIKEKTYISAEEQRINIRIKEMLLNIENVARTGLDPIGDRVKSLLRDDEPRWTRIINHFKSQSGKSKPPKKWLEESKKMVDDEMEAEFIRWFDIAIDLLKAIHKDKESPPKFLSELSIQQVRGAIWTCGLNNSDPFSNKLEELGIWCFKKFPGHGAVSVKLGNATIYAFSILPFKDGIERLTKYRMKIKYSSVLSLIENTIKRVANQEGKSMDQLEEMSVSGFGLDENYEKRVKVGDCEAIIQIQSVQKVDLQWKSPSGNRQKSIPSVLNEGHKANIKHLKAQVKDIQTSLSAQKDRLESYFLKKRSWTIQEWKDFYHNHFLVSFISGKLIWKFSGGNREVICIAFENGFANPSGRVSFDEIKPQKVELWHPIYASTQEVKAWREFLYKHEIQQPFKQAFREIYLLTDAEITTGTYSNRFAAHILRQHQFTALCQQRHWKYTLMGQWDSHNVPTLKIPEYDMHAEFWVEGDWDGSSANDLGVFNYIFTDQVRFYDRERQLQMEKVPAIVFSEVMRDVDMFVGVTSIGNDPNWTDAGNNRLNVYWSNYTFQNLGETAKMRKQTLEFLVPKLKIRHVCEFEKNYLVVKGKVRTYKIHIGCGNILMKPNDQYLCIVPNRKTSIGKVYLPFEGDNMLSIIISKALLLADDDKITDRTILSQIKR